MIALIYFKLSSFIKILSHFETDIHSSETLSNYWFFKLVILFLTFEWMLIFVVLSLTLTYHDLITNLVFEAT